MPRSSGVTQSALARTTLCAIAVLAVVSAMLAVCAPAFAGGEEAHAPPSAGPPGPWNDREVG